MVRDTTDRDGAMLAVSAAAWQAFTSKIKSVLQGHPSEGEPSGGRPLLRVRPPIPDAAPAISTT